MNTSFIRNHRIFTTPQFKFLIVGGINTAFGFTAFALFTWLGWIYPFAIGLSTVLGIGFNFKTTRRWVFKNQTSVSLHRFAAAYALTYLTNVGGVAFLLRLGINAYAAGAIVFFSVPVLSFYILRRFVFRTS